MSHTSSPESLSWSLVSFLEKIRYSPARILESTGSFHGLLPPPLFELRWASPPSRRSSSIQPPREISWSVGFQSSIHSSPIICTSLKMTPVSTRIKGSEEIEEIEELKEREETDEIEDAEETEECTTDSSSGSTVTSSVLTEIPPQKSRTVMRTA